MARSAKVGTANTHLGNAKSHTFVSHLSLERNRCALKIGESQSTKQLYVHQGNSYVSVFAYKEVNSLHKEIAMIEQKSLFCNCETDHLFKIISHSCEIEVITASGGEYGAYFGGISTLIVLCTICGQGFTKVAKSRVESYIE
jgi:hypothetical protein